MTDDADFSLDEMLHLLRSNGYGPLSVPVGVAVEPALAHFRNGVVTMLVWPIYGDATVTRTECVNDETRPDWLVKSLLFRWTAPKEEAARWLLEDHGLVPEAQDQR